MAAPTYLVLDIETVPDRELFDPAPAGLEGERPFPPLYACRPVAIGGLWLDQDLRLERMDTIGDAADEPGMLAAFAALMDSGRPHLVTWNGRGFDLPVLSLRSLRHGVSWPWYYRERDYRHRYSDEGHLDLGDFLADHGAARMTSLDGAARLIGLPGKQGMNGSQVEGLYEAGDLEAIRRYCLQDVVQTAFVFLRARLLTGALDRRRYQEAAGALLEGVSADGRMTDLVTAVDRDRLLLAASPGPS